MPYPRFRGYVPFASLAASGTLLALASGCEGGERTFAATAGAPLTAAQAGSAGTIPNTGGGAAVQNGSSAGAVNSTAGAANVTGGGGNAGSSMPPSAGAAGSPTLGTGGAGGSNVVAAVGGRGEPGGAGADSGGASANGGVGGAPIDENPVAGDPVPSTGCGQAPPASDRYSIDVDGMSREYILSVPEGYDPEQPYRLIFTWHPWGGSAEQVAGNGSGGYYGLLSASGGEVILVSPEGLDFGGNGLGWGNEGGQDIAFLEAMIERFDAELCFDHSRMFSTGFSFGGMMSNAVACSGLARAVAPMAGSGVSGCEEGTQPVAYMGFHGNEDSVVDIEGGESLRDVFVERNGCGAQIESDSDWCEGAGSDRQPCTCTTYEGCQEGYPVTWCEFTGPHMPAPNSGETIWNFFSQF